MGARKVTRAKIESAARSAALGLGLVPGVGRADGVREVMVRIGIARAPNGEDRVALTIGAHTLYLTADRAEEYAVDLRNFAIELRNGGQLA